ncbi:Uncharacterized RING finger protein [Morus notabilis]|uniref:Uncharacterized RING finger protein n=1 Tax=Morus notabilis TaxID=981085 RepID=W9QXC1_9ROSA|nr:Uncharacterized RING finger protein [Morus notabilis]
MGGDGDYGDSPTGPPPPDDAVPEEDDSSPASSLLRNRLAESPILLLVYFHKAFRAEVADLRRAVANASERGHHSRDFNFELLRRFEFLKLATKYHCAAEDEVIFLALDVHVKNVASTYSLEHKSIDGLFDSIFFRLNAMLEENGDQDVSVKPFQELVFCIGTIETFISNHMLKEEKQIFPSLMEHISTKEQASLVWQFLCSVPIVLLEDMFPWMLSFLSPEEQVEVTDCVREIVPEEKSLQEVVLSWLGNNVHSSLGSYRKSGGVADMKMLLKSYSCRRLLGDTWRASSHNEVGHNPVDGLHLWHGAIRKDLIAVLEELYQSRSSSEYSNLDKLVVRLKFLADIITFYRYFLIYSNALDKLFCPVLNQLVHGCMSPSAEGFRGEKHIEGLQMLLYQSAQKDINVGKFVNKLCWELESFIVELSKQFAFHEAEVFSIIGKNCSHQTQRQLLFASVHMMPLGLLKCVITWFSSHLSDDESRSILNRIKQEDSSINGSLGSLLHEWFRTGCSGKISIEKFGKNLQQMFKSRRSFLSEKIKDGAGSSSLYSNKQPCEESDLRLKVPSSAKMGKSCLSYSSSCGHTARKCETSYSSVINLYIYFPEALKGTHPFSEILGGESHSGSVLNDPKPMDLIFYFHKALKKDLEYLVCSSIQLAAKVGLLEEFCRRFNLIQFLYQIHSEAEDEIAFPALEAMGKATNISHSYTMDHKHESEHFRGVSLILDKLSELSVALSEVDSNRDQIMRKHYQLCMELHVMCKSMYELLSDHIHREELELWPLFRECFSVKEQEKIVGSILGRTNAEILQDMLPWLMGSLTQEEQHIMMSLWHQITRNTMFDEWLREWWEGYDISEVAEESNVAPSTIDDPLKIIFEFLCEVNEQQGKLCSQNMIIAEKGYVGGTVNRMGDHKVDEKPMDSDFDLDNDGSLEHRGPYTEDEKKRTLEVQNVTCQIKPGAFIEAAQNSKYYHFLLEMSQEDLEAAIRRVSRDSSFDSQKKSYIIQNLLVSRWIVRHHSHLTPSSNEQEFPGQHASYRDPLNLSFGCKHYKRNCKLVAPCCNQLYTCLRCHDDMADHTIDREIYHCPYCNLCRLGKGLGIDYFHCMNCNACMARTLFMHVCREKSFMDNCPICHEDIFTSSLPVKALRCGHMMHSKCFEAYTCTSYTCPICGKSLGDMKVYFNMLDALLAEEKIPDEYSSQTQAILCNDCEKRGEAPFHWRYHKCSLCGSYNTRVL